MKALGIVGGILGTIAFLGIAFSLGDIKRYMRIRAM
ncbi:MAG: DUF6893 family small protein [Dehalococcoidia bacterium]